MDLQPEKSLSEDGWCRTKLRITGLYGCQTEKKLICFALGHVISITGYLIGVKKQRKFCCYVKFSDGKESFGFKQLLELV